MRSSRGFTLIEALVVVIILAIMAAAVLPRLRGQAEKSKTAEAVNIMSSVRHALMSYYDEHLHWPDDLASADAMEATLGMTFGAPVYGWSFETIKSGTDCTVKASNTDGGTLSLDAQTGKWSGTGNYCDPSCEGGEGEYWPHLPQ
jgi:prepilin-type N-terminal cleavage/methylation domain-containing protein